MNHVPTVTRAGDEPATPAISGGTRLEALPGPLAPTVIKGTLLTILTLGFYRFWYRTNLRRYYWSHTRFLGDGFDYTGTGRELFIGFLIALAIIVPVNGAITLISIYGGEIAGPVLSTLAALVVVPILVQIALYRARRYRLSRTRFRGIRFRQTGTGTAYLLRTLKWLVITLLTFGITLPHLRAAQERYRIENTWFGSAEGAFDVPIGPLLKTWLLPWGAVAAEFALMIGFGFAAAEEEWGVVSAIGILMLVGLPALVLLWFVYKVREFRAFANGTRLGPLAFRSDLRLASLLGIFLRYAAVLVAIGAALAFLAYSLSGIDGFDRDGSHLDIIDSRGTLLLLLPIFGLVFMVALGVLGELLLRKPLWRVLISSITVLNTEAVPGIVQTAQQDSQAIGEAFDSGFDLPM